MTDAPPPLPAGTPAPRAAAQEEEEEEEGGDAFGSSPFSCCAPGCRGAVRHSDSRNSENCQDQSKL